MSAAINDRTHDALLSRLPLTGEFHPLRREFERLLATGNAIALTFAILACAMVYVWPRENPIIVDHIKVVEHTIGGFVPSITPPGRNDTKFEAPAPVDHGIYEPVDRVDLETPAEPNDGYGGDDPDAGAQGSNNGFGGEFDSTFVPPTPPVSPEYNWWDEAPVLLSCEAPVYPAMVSDAGIDGTVHVRVLVDLNGKVKDARVVDGPAVLREAALASARTALFKPALQGVHPVEVWVVIPITFQLRGDR